MVAVPLTVGVHLNTFSGPVAFPQVPDSAFAPLVAPVKVPPDDAMTVGLLQVPLDVLAIVVGVLEVVVVAAAVPPAGVTVSAKVPGAPSHPSPTMSYVNPALTPVAILQPPTS